MRNWLGRAWEREQQGLEQRRWLYKVLMVVAGLQVVSALFNLDSNPWFALLAVVNGILFVVVALLLYRAHKVRTGRESP